jgi:type IV secretion system protein VirD4
MLPVSIATKAMEAAMFGWLKSERQKYATRISDAPEDFRPTLTDFDPASRELYEKALPRGVLMPRLEPDRDRENLWMSAYHLLQHRYVPGQLIIGKLGNTYLGHMDDRPIVTIAGARSGKSSTVLAPNLYCYLGSLLALDPKGELASLAAKFRRAMGHNVYVLDPFGTSDEPSASFNPLEALDPEDDMLVDDVAAIAGALVVDDGDSRSQHWNNSARTLLIGIILLTLTLEKPERNLVTVRELLCLTYPVLAITAQREADLAEKDFEEKEIYFNKNAAAVKTLLRLMVRSARGKFAKILAGVGNRFLAMPMTELGSVLSTTATHTDFLDSLPLRRILMRSDFQLSTLRSDRPASIFLSLPVTRMDRHYRFLRMIVQLACTTLELMGPYPRDRLPILFMMEEFATLGHMPVMEHAAAYFPGFGIKLWAVLQSLPQLQRHYKATWETIVGNAGLVQMFANGDEETLRYAASRMDRLIAPFEMRMAFSRARGSQLLLMEGLPPAAAMRLSHEDVEYIRERVRTRISGLPDVTVS